MLAALLACALPAAAGRFAAAYAVGTITSSSREDNRRPMDVGFYDAGVNKTFVSWTGPNSNPYVRAFDHTTGTWGSSVRVGTSPFDDDHNYPVLVRAPDGRLNVFYGAHNTTLRRARSANPSSEAGTWTDGYLNAAPYASYPMPVVADNGVMYLFYRETSQYVNPSYFTDDRPLKLLKSTDSGLTWTDLGYAIETDRSDNLDEIYVGQIRHVHAHGTVPEQFLIVWSIAGGGPGNHAHDVYHRNVYYASFRPSTEHFYSADGTDLGASIDTGESETRCKIYDTGTPSGWDVSFMNLVNADDYGRPIVVWNWTARDQAKASKWTGSSWRTTDVPASYAFDMEKAGPDAYRIYKKTGQNLEFLLTTDGGATWQTDGIIDLPSSFHQATAIDDFNPTKRILLQEDKPDTGLAMWVVGAPIPAPASPTGLAAATVKNQRGKIKLTWNAVIGASSYKAKRSSSSGGPYGTVATGLTTGSYTDGGLTSGSTYCYVVSAVGAGGESANSTEACAAAG